MRASDSFRRGIIGASVLLVSAWATGAEDRDEHIACTMAPSAAEVQAERELQAAGAYQIDDRGGALLAVRISFHIVRTTAGSGGLTEDRLEQALADANLAFGAAGITFCRAGPTNYINNDYFYTGIVSLAGINQLRTTDVVPNTINVYCAEAIAVEGTSLGGISSFSTSPVQGIVMRNSHMGAAGNSSTFPHEIGHYFNLYHTHETSFGAECANGANCLSTGDLLCDTPADPRLGSHNVFICQYGGVEVDPCGGGYAPDVRNHMSYSLRYCADRFSPQQNAKARATLLNLRPQYLVEVCRQLCIGDATMDGRVDMVDIIASLTHWGVQYGVGQGVGDANFDGVVDFDDISAALSRWGAVCDLGVSAGSPGAPCCPGIASGRANQ